MELLFLQKASLAPEATNECYGSCIHSSPSPMAQKYIFYAATATSPVLNGIFSNNKLTGIKRHQSYPMGLFSNQILIISL